VKDQAATTNPDDGAHARLPELSDLIVDFDRHTLERRDVMRQAVLDALSGREKRLARHVLAGLATPTGVLDRASVDGVLVRSHLELQRLHEEFHVGAMMRDLVTPMVALARDRTQRSRVRVVDLGCGLGFVLRWLAARGNLGPDVELVGADCNRVLARAAQRLADDERLSCRFVAGNAFTLREPADVVISTGVLHHFRGDDLVTVFAQHERSSAVGFVHVDIRPSIVAPLGSWIFHQARMREPLARFDGVRSVVRAHDAGALRAAMSRGAPGFTLAMVDARPGLHGLLRIFQAVVGARGVPRERLRDAYGAFGSRIDVA
jgi:2-polyprenyl-3-methyl-5-hydroxy-6-metoxy-1,4-benzoquinol methylase